MMPFAPLLAINTVVVCQMDTEEHYVQVKCN